MLLLVQVPGELELLKVTETDEVNVSVAATVSLPSERDMVLLQLELFCKDELDEGIELLVVEGYGVSEAEFVLESDHVLLLTILDSDADLVTETLRVADEVAVLVAERMSVDDSRVAEDVGVREQLDVTVIVGEFDRSVEIDVLTEMVLRRVPSERVIEPLLIDEMLCESDAVFVLDDVADRVGFTV